MRLILLLAIGVVGYLIYKLYLKNLLSQGKAGKIKIALIALGLVFLALAVSGRAPAFFAIIGAAMTQVMRFMPLLVRHAPALARMLGVTGLGGAASAFGGGSAGSHGQQSRVKTRLLVMTLDHATGQINGDIIDGPYTGKQLSELTTAELKQFYGECVAGDPEAVRMLQAYISREREDWAGAPDDQSASKEPVGIDGITVREAYDILGIEQGASPSDINAAHRSLIGKMHPDKGGSTYLAAKINAAKKVLLAHVKGG